MMDEGHFELERQLVSLWPDGRRAQARLCMLTMLQCDDHN